MNIEIIKLGFVYSSISPYSPPSICLCSAHHTKIRIKYVGLITETLGPWSYSHRNANFWNFLQTSPSFPRFPPRGAVLECWSVGVLECWGPRSMTNTSSLGPAAAGSHSCTLQLDHLLIASIMEKRNISRQAYPVYSSF